MAFPILIKKTFALDILSYERAHARNLKYVHLVHIDQPHASHVKQCPVLIIEALSSHSGHVSHWWPPEVLSTEEETLDAVSPNVRARLPSQQAVDIANVLVSD